MIMIKLFSSKLTLAFIGLLIVLCQLDAAKAQTPANTASEPTRRGRPVAKPAVETPNIVARIGNYLITKQELEKRLIMKLYPNDYDYYNEQDKVPDAESVLMNMIAEKAMVTEARKQGHFDNDETLGASIKRFREIRLVNLLLTKSLQDKLTVTEEQIDKQLKASPKLDRARAEMMLKNAKARQLIDQYYKQIYQKFHVKKLSNNFPRAVQIHQRLLHQPKEPRRMAFIRISQTKDELTQQEKDIVLAEYDNGGKVTLKDWFDTLCNFSPPSRPKDLNTTKGVEQLLERALRTPLFVAEAKLLGLDKDKNLLEQVRKYEDDRLLYKVKVQSEKYKEIKEPDTEQIIAYFGKNKEAFRTNRTLKIDLIWCQDLKTARKAKAELDDGKDFEAVKQKYSLEKKLKPYNTNPGSEGLLWKDLWKNDPNEIAGPLKGFYRSDIKWRIVNILEKNPGEVKDYSSDMEQSVKEKMLSEQRDTILAEYGKELLKKYQYKIHADRIKDIDPLDIP